VTDELAIKRDFFAGYRITSTYGYRTNQLDTKNPEFHKGIDLVKYDQAPIEAFTAGEVVHAGLGVTGSGFGGYGIVVAVRDDNGALHCYAHMSSASVKVKEQVAIGQVVGKQGSTGQSTGSHLHYEVRTKGSAPNFGYGTHTDPAAYLQQYFDAKEEALKVEELLKRIESLESRIAALEENAALPEPPEWAKDAVDAAVAKGILKEANGGGYDFYRIMTVLHRNGVF